jgi:uncharacterized membrane protein YkvA (DUF1232 family)
MKSTPQNASDGTPKRIRDRVKTALRTINTDFVKKGSRTVSEDDVHDVVEKADAIEKRFSKEGPLGRLVDDGRLLLALVKDYWRREYRHLPYWTLSAVVFTLLYIANPFDLVPDALPGVGLIDDAAVLSVCLLMVEQDLYDYRAWKQGQDDVEPSDGDGGESVG